MDEFHVGNKRLKKGAIMPTADAKKCAHPKCSCEAMPGREFFSETCSSEQASKSAECQCGHSGCGEKN